jgi:bifunctional DNA-binding transcriptional regulator/antitoxin component of YhaV-PrlF toxin-antitoxin module
MTMSDQAKSESEIRQRYQTTVPQEVRERMGLEVGDSLLWTYDEERDEIRIIKKPQSFSDSLWGLGSLLKKEDVPVTRDEKGENDHVQSERQEV